MIYADYETKVATTEKGERYTFQDKEKMYKFLRETVKEAYRNSNSCFCKPYVFKGITK